MRISFCEREYLSSFFYNNSSKDISMQLNSLLVNTFPRGRFGFESMQKFKITGIWLYYDFVFATTCIATSIRGNRGPVKGFGSNTSLINGFRGFLKDVGLVCYES